MDDVRAAAPPLAGAMVGRDACRRPWHYATIDSAVYPRPRRNLLAGNPLFWASADISTSWPRRRRDLAAAEDHRGRTRRPRRYGTANPAASRRDALEAYGAYAAAVEAEAAGGSYSPRRALLKPLLPLFHGDAGTGAFKRAVDALHREPLPVRDVIRAAAERVPDWVLDSAPGVAGRAAAPVAGEAAVGVGR